MHILFVTYDYEIDKNEFGFNKHYFIGWYFLYKS